MEVKHQVFVSSTYKDLIEERRSVIHALLELDCIPAGMELFPATDEDAWTLIKEVIDGCDYYVLVLAGKYGSTNSLGVSYTEMEYDYAISSGKPVIAFLHENVDSLTGSNIEKTENLQSKLHAFRKKAESHKHCKYWKSAEDLGGKVSRSLIQLKKRHPSPGWIPGKYAATDAMMREFEEMRAKIAEYELSKLILSPPSGSERLSQGSDLVYTNQKLKPSKDVEPDSVMLSVSWDMLFSYCGPSLVGECEERVLLEKMKLAFWHAATPEARELNNIDNIIIPYVTEDKIKIQFQALGLMTPGTKKRAVSDTAKYWKSTPYGENYLISIRAARKPTQEIPPLA